MAVAAGIAAAGTAVVAGTVVAAVVAAGTAGLAPAPSAASPSAVALFGTCRCHAEAPVAAGWMVRQSPVVAVVFAVGTAVAVEAGRLSAFARAASVRPASSARPPAAVAFVLLPPGFEVAAVVAPFSSVAFAPPDALARPPELALLLVWVA